MDQIWNGFEAAFKWVVPKCDGFSEQNIWYVLLDFHNLIYHALKSANQNLVYFKTYMLIHYAIFTAKRIIFVSTKKLVFSFF